MNEKTTLSKTLLIGVVGAFLSSIPIYKYIFLSELSPIFPFGWMMAGMSYMKTFFHELGHTFTAWFYGYPTIPMFDFNHGGGLALIVSGQKFLILGAVWAGLVYGIYKLSDYRPLQLILSFLLIINLLTFWNEELRFSIIDFMGPGAVPIMASFFLYRAIFDVAPVGNLERYLNSIVGFGFIFYSYLAAFGLLRNDVYRTIYYLQKGQHGFGDFDKISDRFLSLSFDGAITIWIVEITIFFTLPFILYYFLQYRYRH